MVNLEWYRSFVEVYRVGTVSGAATGLHLTQPAVSQHVAALEATLGVKLFDRLPRRMLPTEAGQRLYTRVVAAIEALTAIPTKATLADAPLLIRLGTPIEFFSEYVVSRLPKSDSPSVTPRLTVRFGLAPDLIEQLLDHQIDCAIATQKIVKPELEYRLIFTESFWLVGPPAVPAIAGLPTDLTALEQWLKTQPWIAYSEELPIIRRFWRVILGRRLDLNPQWVMPDLCSIRSAIAAGLGYSVLPDYLCTAWLAEQRLTLLLKPEPAVTNSIWLAYRKSERQSQPVTLLLSWLGPADAAT
jgi:DNA-binding transcriptional LysR family regulator